MEECFASLVYGSDLSSCCFVASWTQTVKRDLHYLRLDEADCSLTQRVLLLSFSKLVFSNELLLRLIRHRAPSDQRPVFPSTTQANHISMLKVSSSKGSRYVQIPLQAFYQFGCNIVPGVSVMFHIFKQSWQGISLHPMLNF